MRGDAWILLERVPTYAPIHLYVADVWCEDRIPRDYLMILVLSAAGHNALATTCIPPWDNQLFS